MRCRCEHRCLCGSRGSVRWGALIGAVAAAFLTVTAALATFSSPTTGGPMTVTSKRIFPGIRSTSAWSIGDASGGGAEASGDDALTYADGTTKSTGNWATTFAANRWLEFDFNSARPGGVPVSSATFNFRMAANGNGETACFYFEVYRASTSALRGTYGSSGTPLACNSTTTQTTYTQAISEITDTTILDDLRIRVYGKESGARAMKVDMATVTGSTAYASYTMYEKIYRDQANGTLATTSWSVATSGDGASYPSAANWATTFSATRYLRFTFDASVPAGSVLTGATVDFSYKSNVSGNTACWYLEVYNGATLIGTHGSSGTPISCNATTSFVTDNVSIPEVDTVSKANNLIIRAYMKESGGKKNLVDFVQANLNYYLD